MRIHTIALIFSLLSSLPAIAQQSGWLSAIVKAETRSDFDSEWKTTARLKVEKRAGAPSIPEISHGSITLDGQDKVVRFSISNFAYNQNPFLPNSVSISYLEGNRQVGPIEALLSQADGRPYQVTLRFRDKTYQSKMSIALAGNTNGTSIRDTFNITLLWGAGQPEGEPADTDAAYFLPQSAGSPQVSAGYAVEFYQGGQLYSLEELQNQLRPMLPSGAMVYAKREAGQYNYRIGPFGDDAAQAQALRNSLLARTGYRAATVVYDKGGTGTYPAKGPSEASPSSYDFNAAGLGQQLQYGYAVQFATTTTRPDMQRFQDISAPGTLYSKNAQGLYFLRLGQFKTLQEAEAQRQQLAVRFPDAFIVVERNAPIPMVGAPGSGRLPEFSSRGQARQESAAGRPASYEDTESERTTENGLNLPSGAKGYAIQLASFRERGTAVSQVEQLREQGVQEAYVWEKGENKRVVVASFPDKISAKSYLNKLQKDFGLEGIIVSIQ